MIVLVTATGCYNLIHPLPDGVSFEGPPRSVQDVRFLADLTWTDEEGNRHVEQNIFNAVFEIIRNAERYIVVDMFLYNDFQGTVPELTRGLSGELTQALIARKREHPEMSIVVISDPVNTVYGGLQSKHFDALVEVGIPVVITKLDRLRDSNPGYSTFWRVLAKPLGNLGAGVLPSPFSEDKVSMLNYLSLLNFKANHRKTILADHGAESVALVTSANPHDGSSAHGNVALVFQGAAVADLLETEKAVVNFSASQIEMPEITLPEAQSGEPTVQVLTEGKIRNALMRAYKRAAEGDQVDVAVFYLSDRGIIDAIADAHERGAQVRVLLDPNKDAFGREKGGVPNRPVAAKLRERGVPVRWCDTHGEQCHAKMTLVQYENGESVLILGSANYTRRNLQDLNLETNVAIRGTRDTQAIRDAKTYMDLIWNNEPHRRFSTDYEQYADESLLKKFLYEVEERTGFSTF